MMITFVRLHAGVLAWLKTVVKAQTFENALRRSCIFYIHSTSYTVSWIAYLFFMLVQYSYFNRIGESIYHLNIVNVFGSIDVLLAWVMSIIIAGIGGCVPIFNHFFLRYHPMSLKREEAIKSFFDQSPRDPRQHIHFNNAYHRWKKMNPKFSNLQD
jgi:formate-dependent nitrite reductase membrane component NrfD